MLGMTQAFQRRPENEKGPRECFRVGKFPEDFFWLTPYSRIQDVFIRLPDKDNCKIEEDQALVRWEKCHSPISQTREQRVLESGNDLPDLHFETELSLKHRSHEVPGHRGIDLSLFPPRIQHLCVPLWFCVYMYVSVHMCVCVGVCVEGKSWCLRHPAQGQVTRLTSLCTLPEASMRFIESMSE